MFNSKLYMNEMLKIYYQRMQKLNITRASCGGTHRRLKKEDGKLEATSATQQDPITK